MYTYTNTYKIKHDMHIDMSIYIFIYVHCPSCHCCHRLCHCNHRCLFFVVTTILGTCVSFFSYSRNMSHSLLLLLIYVACWFLL